MCPHSSHISLFVLCDFLTAILLIQCVCAWILVGFSLFVLLHSSCFLFSFFFCLTFSFFYMFSIYHIIFILHNILYLFSFFSLHIFFRLISTHQPTPTPKLLYPYTPTSTVVVLQIAACFFILFFLFFPFCNKNRGYNTTFSPESGPCEARAARFQGWKSCFNPGFCYRKSCLWVIFFYVFWRPWAPRRPLCDKKIFCRYWRGSIGTFERVFGMV